jgi:hypothetical protein
MTSLYRSTTGDSLTTGARVHYRGAHRRTPLRTRLRRWPAARLRALAARLDPIPPRIIFMAAAR